MGGHTAQESVVMFIPIELLAAYAVFDVVAGVWAAIAWRR